MIDKGAVMKPFSPNRHDKIFIVDSIPKTPFNFMCPTSHLQCKKTYSNTVSKKGAEHPCSPSPLNVKSHSPKPLNPYVTLNTAL